MIVHSCSTQSSDITKAPSVQEGEDQDCQRLLWVDQIENGDLHNLCHVLLHQLYFGRLYRLLGPEVILADFTARNDDGSAYLTTEKLEEYLLARRAEVEQLTQEERLQLKEECEFMLEQAAMILRHLAQFLEWAYTTRPVEESYPYNDEPLGNTHFARVVLHQALVQACGRVLGTFVRAGNSISLRSTLPWLEGRMQRGGLVSIYSLEIIRDM